MNRVYFWMFLFHYFVTLITGCTQLYLVLLGNIGFIDLVSIGIYIIELVLQFGYWCFAVEEIVYELSTISNAIYMSKWYQKGKIVKNILLIVMMKAQRQKYMTAGGLMDINIYTFGSVIRKIFSFCAVLKNLLNN
ncbi:7tm Odorant receptor [Popillia japonica]|uniref:7tm Odorant receptor n=1 Tax=Popillia japonica TaxID=7064 RepID=A0AAW1NJU1_POPJA